MRKYDPADIKRWNDPEERKGLIKRAKECEPKRLRWQMWWTEGSPWEHLYIERFIKEHLCFNWDSEKKEGCGKEMYAYSNIDNMPYCEEHLGEITSGFFEAVQSVGGIAL